MPSNEDLKYLRMAPDDLDISIGTSLLEGSLGAKAPTDAEKRSAASQWFAANLERFRKNVCGSELIRKKLFGNNQQDRNILFGTVIDILAKLGGFPVPVAAIAAKLIHYELDQLCLDKKGEK